MKKKRITEDVCCYIFLCACKFVSYYCRYKHFLSLSRVRHRKADGIPFVFPKLSARMK